MNSSDQEHKTTTNQGESRERKEKRKETGILTKPLKTVRPLKVV